MAALGPLMDTLGATTKGVTFELGRGGRATCATRTAWCAAASPTAARRWPATSTACEAILALSGTTNGHLATQGFETLEARTGVRLADLAAEHEGKRITFADTQGAPGAGHHLTGVVGVGVRRPALLPVHHQRRAAQALAHADRADALLPRPRLDDRARRGAAGLPAAAEHAGAVRRAGASATTGALGVTVRYLTPHSKWSIHSEYQDNLFMLSLSRGGQTIWMSKEDAAKVGVGDNDWVEAVNRNGVVVARAIVSHRMPEGTVYMHHAQDRLIDVPIAETSGRRGGIHNSLTRLMIKPSHLIGGYAQLSFAFNYLGPTGNQRDEVTVIRTPLPGGAVLMRVMAQMAMVMNLDKCIGCHTCSVTCKQAWTNRAGTEYVWFNNVETRPGQGYPRRYEDQETWKGGWALEPPGQPHPQGRRPGEQAAAHLLQPQAAVDPGLLRAVDLRLQHAHRRARAGAHARWPGPKSLISGNDMKITWSANWDDDLGGSHRPRRQGRPAQEHRRQGEVRVRADLHVLPAPHLRALPQPVLRGVVPVGGDLQARPRTASSWSTRTGAAAGACASPGCPYKKVYFNHRTGKAEKCTFCFPRVEVGLPTVCSETCVGRLRYIGLVLYDADRVLEAASTPDDQDLYEAQRSVFLDPHDPDRDAGGRAGRHPARLGPGGAALTGLGADQHVPGRAAAAPGVPHHADGLVHPAAVAGRRRRPRHRPRRRGRRQPVRRHRRAAHPGRVPRRAVHRR